MIPVRFMIPLPTNARGPKQNRKTKWNHPGLPKPKQNHGCHTGLTSFFQVGRRRPEGGLAETIVLLRCMMLPRWFCFESCRCQCLLVPYFRSDGSERQPEQNSIAKKLAFIDSRVAAGQSIGDSYAPLPLREWEEPCSQEIGKLIPPAYRAA